MKSGRQEFNDTEQLYTAWFDTFVQRTDEKEINAEIMGLIFSQLRAANLEIKGSFLDIGCGNGELSLKLAQLLKKLEVNFSYVGIDNKKDYVEATKNV